MRLLHTNHMSNGPETYYDTIELLGYFNPQLPEIFLSNFYSVNNLSNLVTEPACF